MSLKKDNMRIPYALLLLWFFFLSYKYVANKLNTRVLERLYKIAQLGLVKLALTTMLIINKTGYTTRN